MTVQTTAGGVGPLPNPMDPTGTLSGWIGDAVGAGQKVASGITGGVGGVDTAVNAIAATRRWVSDRHNWLRVGYFAAGGALVLVGLSILVRKPAHSLVESSGLSPSDLKSTLVGATKTAVTKGK